LERTDDSSSRWQDLGAFIREQRRLAHLSMRKLAEIAGVSNPYLSQIERGLRKPSAEILQQIARGLSISAESLYVRAGILEERTDAVDVIAEIRRDPTITADQREALIRTYEAFRAQARAEGGYESPNDRGDTDPAGSSESSEDTQR
jgi:transcriptional regulator with XRE-family HTH domain